MTSAASSNCSIKEMKKSAVYTPAARQTTVPLLVAFLVVCVAELVMGWLLWRGRRSGTVLAFALLPFELAFWVGFALRAATCRVWSRLPGWSSATARAVTCAALAEA